MIVLRQMSRHQNMSLRDNRDSTFRQHLVMKSSNEDALRQTCRNVARVRHIQILRPTPYSKTPIILRACIMTYTKSSISNFEKRLIHIYTICLFQKCKNINYYGVIDEAERNRDEIKLKNISRFRFQSFVNG